MRDYKVKGNAPYFLWRQSTQKARAGNLWDGYDVSGEVRGSLLLIEHDLPKDEPPYVMNLSDLVQIDVQPEPQTPSELWTFYVSPGDLEMAVTIDGVEKATFENANEIKWVRKNGS